MRKLQLWAEFWHKLRPKTQHCIITTWTQYLSPSENAYDLHTANSNTKTKQAAIHHEHVTRCSPNQNHLHNGTVLAGFLGSASWH